MKMHFLKKNTSSYYKFHRGNPWEARICGDFVRDRDDIDDYLCLLNNAVVITTVLTHVAMLQTSPVTLITWLITLR